MANIKPINRLKKSVEDWNKWREKYPHIDINLGEADLAEAKLSGANLSGANLSEADFSRADLTKADLTNANLSFAELSGADLTGANLIGAYLNNASLIRTDLTGSSFWKAELSEAILTGAHLNGANLVQANLKGASLVHATLAGARLTNADLKEAELALTHFYHADLDGADLRGANLREANLSEADLSFANLSRTLIAGSNFVNAKIDSTIFGDLELSEVIGLDSVNHRSPSIIGTNTIAKSKGKIPEVFLRGCGLSDWEIESAKLYNPDLTNEEIVKIQYRMFDLRATQSIQISPLFISYSHTDSAFVNKLETYLNKKGIRFWRDIHDMKAGRIETQIDQAISQNRTVLLVLSKHSIKSDWVQHEVRTTRELEKEVGRDILCPVALDDSWKTSSWPKRVMEQVMEYNILPFSSWKDDSVFEQTFVKLIDGLQLFYKG